jgi:hypothetical protein
MPPGVNGTCYASPVAVNQNFGMCDVTNQKILDLLKEEKHQVTVSCNATGATPAAPGGFARLDKDAAAASGKDGSVDIRGFLTEEVRGPGELTCDCAAAPALGGTRQCEFNWPAMNQLISDIFGDASITLACRSGECLHASQNPGHTGPPAAVCPVGVTEPSARSPRWLRWLPASSWWRLRRRFRATLGPRRRFAR